MPKIIINKVECEGEVGERIVDIARRHAVHIGFLCDGPGAFFVESSACRVLRGSEHLSPPSELEQNWLQQSWLDAGHRLACEMYLRGSGPVELLSRAEELRLQTFAVVSPPEGTTSGENLGLLLNNMGRIFVNQLVRFPANFLGSTSHMFKGEFHIQGIFTDVQRMLTDGGRIIQNMMGGTPVEPPQQETPRSLPRESSAKQ